MAIYNVTSEQEVEPSSFDIRQVLTSVWMAPVVLLVVTVIVQRLLGSKAPKLNMPPMVKGQLPLFGTMFKTRGPQTPKILIDIGKEYGPLYTLKTGIRYFFVVMNSAIAHEALIQGGEVFSTRPKLQSRLNYTGFKSVNSALYGPYWRAIRKNMVAQVLTSSKVTSFKPFREIELNSLIERLRDEANENDNVVNVLRHCRWTVFSILLHVCFSKAFNPAELKELDVILRRLLVNLAPQVLDFLPFMQYVSGHQRDCQQLLAGMRRLFTPLIDEHRELRNKGTPAGDYVDSIIVLQKEMNLSEPEVLALIGEVLAGGTDTTANTLEWTVAHLVQQPKLQARLYEEISSVVPSGSLVGEQDIEKMPYLQAVVKEGLRKHPPLPFGITHGVTKQTKLKGYDIPDEGRVLFHFQAILNDPKEWDHPEIFNPDRFMTPTPNPDFDMTGSHGPRSMNFVPFGAGRRQCPGMSLGLKHLHLILARLMHTFEWSTVRPGEDVDFSDQLEFTNVMKKSLYSRIKERSSQ